MGEESIQTKLLELGSCGNIPIKENRKAIAILKIDDFLCVNAVLTLLIGVLRVCWLATSDFGEFRPRDSSQGSEIYSLPHLKSTCLYICLLA